MKTATYVAMALTAVAATLSTTALQAQVAGSSVIAVESSELREVAVGYSAKKQVLGKKVFNDSDQAIGTVDDIVIAPDKSVSYAIINAGGFLSVAKHDVAVPVSQLKLVGDKLVLAGATRDALKASPPFEYAN